MGARLPVGTSRGMCSFLFDNVPDHRGDVVAAERFDLTDARRRCNINFGQIRTDDVDAREDQSALFELGLQPGANFLVAFIELRCGGRATDMQIRARLAGLRQAVERARDFTIDENDAFITVLHFGTEFLHHERFAEHGLKQLDQRRQIPVVRFDAEDCGAAVAVIIPKARLAPT